jgi:drug/metabolite transporter (DMT)-like permease
MLSQKTVDVTKHAAVPALLAALAFGVSTPLAKLLLADIQPLALAALLYLGSGIGLSILAFLRRGKVSADAQFVKADAPWILGTIFFGGILGPVLMLVGLQNTDSASASLLLNLEAVLTLAIAWLVFHEHVDQKLFVGALAIVAGALLLSWQGGFGQIGIASLFIALACLSWAIDNNLTRKISGADPYRLAAVKGLVAGTFNLGLAKFMGQGLPSYPIIAAATLLGFMSYGLGLVLYILALRNLGAARTAAYYGTAPFIGASLGAALPGGIFTPMLLAAGALMGVGVWLHVSERHQHEHLHLEDEHDHLHAHDEHHDHPHEPGVDPTKPHSHRHQHLPLRHVHPHYPDLHHRHSH